MHTVLTLTLALALAVAAAPSQTVPSPEISPDPAPSTTTPAPATVPPPSETPLPDRLRVVLITLGPGTAVWERFGHNALWIHDPTAGTDIAYHYGLFDMAEEGFLLNFLQGRMFYSIGANDALRLLEHYRRVGRDAYVQELRLTQHEIRELQTFLEWNLQPENRVYRYDYFRDNCSTRIRDALDRVLDGALRETLDSIPSPLTFRAQAVALTAEDVLLTTGMDLGLGPLADKPISRWDLAFIPMRLRDDLRRVAVWQPGDSIPLVASNRHLPAFRAEETPAVPPGETSPPHRALWHLLVGLAIGAVFAGAGRLAGRNATAARVAARGVIGLGGGAWGLVAGVLGLVLLGLWTLTDHEFGWRNENLLQANPLALALMVLAPLAAIRGSRMATRLAAILAALSAAGLLLHFLPVTPQANLPIIALALPIHLGVYYALRQFDRTPGT